MNEICTTCNGTGTCQNCGGIGTTRCTTCNGTGSIPITCPRCAGSGREDDSSICLNCGGTGTSQAICLSCNGAGNFECLQCHSSGKCKDCGGSGRRNETEVLKEINIEDFRGIIINHLVKSFGESGYPGLVVDSLNTSNLTVLLNEFKYGPFETNQSIPTLINKWEFINDSPAAATQRFSKTASVELGETWTVVHGIELGMGLSFKIGEIITGSANTRLTFSETESKTEKKSAQDSNNTDITIPAHSKTVVAVNLFELELSVPWTAFIKITGSFHFTGHSNPNPRTRHTFDGTGMIGRVFRSIGNSNFSIIDDNTISFDASGLYHGVHGQDWKWEVHSEPLPEKEFKSSTISEDKYGIQFSVFSASN